MKTFLNIFSLALRIEALLSKSGFEILNLFALSNDMGFDTIDFITPGNLMRYN